jgi:nicotinamidase-related amidase
VRRGLGVIKRFGADAGLLVIDAQQGVDDLRHWGGERGRRNNPEAESNIQDILKVWRAKGLSVLYTVHDSREADSPLKLNAPGGTFKPGLQPNNGEPIIRKDVNSGFIGTNLALVLRRKNIHRLVVVGFFTNMCVASTVRMAGNMGFDTYLVDDACACTNRIGPDGVDHDPEIIHQTTIATLHGEFCTVLKTEDLFALLAGDAPALHRAQGNE